MIYKNLFFVLLVFFSTTIFSQTKTCESPDENILSDLNSITKCSIEKSEDKKTTKSVAVVVSSRRRVVRKRNTAMGISNTNSSHKINTINSVSDITNKLSTTNTNNLKTIPFSVVEEIPLFEKCEKSSLLKQKECFKKELSNHIKKNLVYPKSAYNKAVQGRVFVYFKINTDGTIGQMKAMSPYQGDLLGEEAKRIIKELPNFKPAKHNGNNVAVTYAMPINFKIPGVKPSNIRKKEVVENINEVLTFNEVTTIPLFETCNSSNNNSLNCYNNEFVKHIENNFAYPEAAVDNNIEGIVNIKFIINKKGNVVNIETKGPKGGRILETSAKILIQKLPKFKPATKNGTPVNTSYSFPVNFTLN